MAQQESFFETAQRSITLLFSAAAFSVAYTGRSIAPAYPIVGGLIGTAAALNVITDKSYLSPVLTTVGVGSVAAAIFKI